MKTGIYVIRNRHDGNVYVGSSATNIEDRWRRHKSDLRRGKHKNRYLQNAWTKHGEESFAFEIIMECEPEDCLSAEQVWVNVFEPQYNINRVVEGSFGVKRTTETKQKIKENHVGFLGKRHSDETKQKMSAVQKGKPKSKEHIEKSVAARAGKFSGVNNPFYGKKHSDETRARMKAAKAARRQAKEK